MKHRLLDGLLVLVILVGLLSGCSSAGLVETGGGRVDLAIVSGSENKSLEPIIAEFARKNGYAISMDYMGSVDMMLAMESAELAYDAVWPAHSLWISLGDEQQKRIRHEESIMRSPVVFGIRQSLAEELGFVGRDVTVEEILDATESGKLKFMMTNATQSNSGATAYLGFLYSFLGSPEVITMDDLEKPELAQKITSLLSAVNRSSGSSGWLKDLYLESGDQVYDGMVNYEALIIEINQELVKRRDETLYVVYPVDGQAIADSPLGYVDKGQADKEAVFLELQQYLLSDEAQAQLLAHGRRTGLVGLDSGSMDPKVFNPDWGIDTERIINQIRLPQPEVIRRALDLYQTSFRKPSLTVFALDYSGSMDGDGERSLEEAMGILLDQEAVERYMLQASPNDITIVIPFSSRALDMWAVQGNDQAQLNELQSRIVQLDPNGGTDIYLPAIEGLALIQGVDDLDSYHPAIILMTDGRSNTQRNWRALTKAWDDSGVDVPVYGILFGDADEDELEEIAEYTHGRVFDGTEDLIHAFRKAKGYN